MRFCTVVGVWRLLSLLDANYRAVVPKFEPPCRWQHSKTVTCCYNTEDIMNLDTFAAYRGFHNMPVPSLKKYAVYFATTYGESLL